MKKIITIFLIFCLCMSLTIPFVSAAEIVPTEPTNSGGSSSGGGFSGGWDEGSSSGGGFSGSWDDEESPFAFTGDTVNAWTVSVYILKVGFIFVYKMFSELIMLTEDVSAWDFILLVTFIGGVLAIIAGANGLTFGDSGTSSSGNSTGGALSKRRKKTDDD